MCGRNLSHYFDRGVESDDKQFVLRLWNDKRFFLYWYWRDDMDIFELYSFGLDRKCHEST